MAVTVLARRLQDGITTVADATARDLAFPLPRDVNQRVYNQATDAVEMWNGAAWVVVLLNGTGLITGMPEGAVIATKGNERQQSDSVAGPTRWRKLRGADAYGWVPVIPRLVIPQEPTIWTFGDSFTIGSGAIAVAQSYGEILTAALNATRANYGQSGTGVYVAIAAIMNIGVTVVPRANNLATWMAGLNDLRRNGAAAKTIAKIQHCLRAWIAFAFSNTSVAASDAAVTKAGVWNNFVTTAVTRAFVIGGNALQALLGATITWNFTGDSLVIGTFVSDGVTASFGPATVTVDGILQTTFDPDNKTDGVNDSTYDNVRVPAVIVLRGLGSGAHVVVIAPTHATKPFIVDYLSTLVAPGKAEPLLVAVPSRLNATGYAIAPNLGSDAVMAAGASAIVDVVNEFGDYPVRSVWPNSEYDLATGVSADNIHPNNIGHYAHAKSFLDQIQGAPPPVFKGTGANSMAVGKGSVASGASSTAGGDGAQASADNATAFGRNALATTPSSVAVGSDAQSAGATSVAVGTSARAPATDATAVGNGAAIVGAGSASSTAIGSGASGTNTNCTAVGKGTTATADRATAVGAVTSATAGSSTALGTQAVAGHVAATAIGDSATTTTPNQVRLGRASEFVSAPGGMSWSHRGIAALRTLDLTDHVILADATAGVFNVTLPDATLAAHLDRTYVVKKIDASGNAVTVNCTGGQTIDGAATKVLAAQWAFVRVMSNGVNWFIIG